MYPRLVSRAGAIGKSGKRKADRLMQVMPPWSGWMAYEQSDFGLTSAYKQTSLVGRICDISYLLS
jgi:hypothetical protein